MSHVFPPQNNLLVFNSANYMNPNGTNPLFLHGLGRRFDTNKSTTVVQTVVQNQEVFTFPLKTEMPANTTMTINLLHYISGNHGTFLLSLGGASGTSYRGVIFNGRIEIDTKSTVNPTLGNMNANDYSVTLSTFDTAQPLTLSFLQFPRS
tara:strand:+ start:1493 stop:1942 length:450 start_codon:yes stop_codon:yes gene_type:complete